MFWSNALVKVNEPSEEEPRLIQRRAPVRSTAENEVYVARNQSLAVLFKRIRRLFDREGHREVVIHGMGASITKAIYVAQDVLMHYGERLSLETHHGTVDVVDDVMGEYESTVEQRRVSSLFAMGREVLEMVGEEGDEEEEWGKGTEEMDGEEGDPVGPGEGIPRCEPRRGERGLPDSLPQIRRERSKEAKLCDEPLAALVSAHFMEAVVVLGRTVRVVSSQAVSLRELWHLPSAPLGSRFLASTGQATFPYGLLIFFEYWMTLCNFGE
ncbi:hypothetical protein AK812_SmicGene35220 [Symbiodinium microadriaticum]|uniref:Uncharacterized protein n=1 Tax=Symbiodinium microadriaticum TaxID=2951 RepID=A0A1Q9CM15_SYMMI|nr:hypothetical protein AK812_SmicGene35220 [Symbiodinium microadriaticum]